MSTGQLTYNLFSCIIYGKLSQLVNTFQAKHEGTIAYFNATHMKSRAP